MDTTTKQRGAVLENHIINGSANLNYNKEQFDALTEKQKTDFIWFSFVQLNLVPEGGIENTPENFDKHFKAIQENKKDYKPSYSTANKDLFFGNFKVNSAAQAMTLIAYGDSSNGEAAKIPFRSLHYKSECEDFKDFMACINLIKEYNEFDASLLRKRAPFYLGMHQFYGASNPNNGNSLFKFEIGREGSPVFYVHYNEYFATKIIKDREGAEVFWEDYTGEDFKENMCTMASAIKADEFSIEESDIFNKKYYTARFWFD